MKGWKFILVAVAMLGVAFGFFGFQWAKGEEVRFESSGVGEFRILDSIPRLHSDTTIVPTITGTDIPDFGKTWYEIRGDLAHPTFPGTSIPDFGQDNSFRIERR